MAIASFFLHRPPVHDFDRTTVKFRQVNFTRGPKSR